MISTREKALQGACEIAKTYGFTQEMLERACCRMALSPAAASMIFPRGPVDVVSYIKDTADKSVLKFFRSLTDGDKKGIPLTISPPCRPGNVVQLALKERLKFIKPYSENWMTALQLIFKYESVHNVVRFNLFADELFFHATKSLHVTRSKRVAFKLSLSAISLASEMHLILDSSKNKVETELFLNSQIQNLMGDWCYA